MRRKKGLSARLLLGLMAAGLVVFIWRARTRPEGRHFESASSPADLPGAHDEPRGAEVLVESVRSSEAEVRVGGNVDAVMSVPDRPVMATSMPAEVPATDATASKGWSRRIGRRRLVGLALAALALIGGVSETNGNFNAQTRNPNNSFASGTLVLANTKQSASTCLSTGGGTTDSNVNNSCDQLINVTVRKPGDSTSGKVTLKNNGSINASALQFYLANCVSADAPAESFHGTGNMCAGVQIYVQEYSDAAFTTKSTCRYGGGTATVCAFDPTKTLSALASAYTSGAPLGFGALATGASVYEEIAVLLPTSADNTLQGRQATFDLNWVLVQ